MLLYFFLYLGLKLPVSAFFLVITFRLLTRTAPGTFFFRATALGRDDILMVKNRLNLFHRPSQQFRFFY